MNAFASHGRYATGGFGVADDFAMRPHPGIMPFASRLGKCLSHHQSRYSCRMMTPNERLRAAREAAGYANAKQAAETFGWAVSTYVQHENGIRDISRQKAPIYARKFNTSAEWLLYGTGVGPIDNPLPSESELATMLEAAQRELPASAALGDWPHYVASGLRARLELFLENGRAPDGQPVEAKPVRGKAGRSPRPTRPVDQE